MRVLLSGGGTGGHIYPALALQKELKNKYPDAEFLYVGTKKGLEAELIPKTGIPFETVDIQGLRRSISLDNVKTVWLMLSAVRRAKQLIKDFKPDVVVGTGGYVCAPVLYAASRLNVPTIIHEQNSVAGISNKFLSRYVDKIAIAFERVRKDFAKYPEKIVVTGNPRAQEVANISEKADLTAYGLKNGRPTVLIFGGSRGALKINEALAAIIPQLEQRDYQVLVASGAVYYEEFAQKFADFNQWDNIKVQAYIDNMPELFNTIDLVVCRSGATTLTELTALGTPSILIPSPNVTENHQEYNARSLVEVDGAEMLLEAELTPDRLLQAIDQLMGDDDRRRIMSQNAQSVGYPNATDLLIAAIESII
ncbi:undecaprenyldiphospho-muramoylpentapeptide beta-N-acetylglucosaminyltransferase [Aerococcus kribbianus]|uniref:UDP-N-acetylglucosamine--N-acetylmuramyl-(pentapeptide) pyrophosphoryl-undecaprenol N-acetylglucosamine transferase n=1 Tax=Aerococcus kribbianus TaxID=2999064 RepID=A0A9X3JGW8_9LACT|nr:MULTISPECIES: undecaprenyldiphospho-muramoylpentapeptide beta-N-acetylglucosaminyltransferase [unclassified Aerococcus]MCZ0717711.1 undecaprenyldiphospho-muramoylpentapeptide beta-N-acetylglucosaminyltransferase [Aerococcus sp. YH-aer221]MCZ0725999.1 undecaprenyldiphospho-muramoylpentapeptide beta-N-acetylglucosaminyltransferase [Aerococcus sp. YH-aer222]